VMVTNALQLSRFQRSYERIRYDTMRATAGTTRSNHLCLRIYYTDTSTMFQFGSDGTYNRIILNSISSSLSLQFQFLVREFSPEFFL